MHHTKRSFKKIPPIEITASWQSNWPLLSFLLLHWIAGKYIHSLNPILKILKFKYLQIRHKPCNQLAIKAQSFPRKSPTCSNTASLMTARLARDFEISRFRDITWDRGCSSNSPPLTHGDQTPYPLLEDSDNQIPSPPGKRCAWEWGGGDVEASIWPIHYSSNRPGTCPDVKYSTIY